MSNHSFERPMPLPSPRQLRHHARRFYGFIHLSINTFNDREWGFGDEPAAIFDPKKFDAEQLVDSALLAGMTGLILTCKHHAGFCLWPSAYTDYSVKTSPFRNGRGDMVREVERACRAAGLEFGVYLSPWDRNHPQYGSPAYIDVYRGQLRELLTQYGETFEVWFDGANGGDGYYGGANEKRSIDNRTYYGWNDTWQIVRDLQPDAVMFSDVGPDVRWVGNEEGIAGDPCWYTMDVGDACPGQADRKLLNGGDRAGGQWFVPECDVSIRPGWFYHATEDARVRSVQNLAKLYYASVGRGANFLLNLAPDRDGLVPEIDRESLRGLGTWIKRTFATDLAVGARGQRTAGPASAPLTVELALRGPQRFNVIELTEDIARGQRISTWCADAQMPDGQWRPIVGLTEAVGAQRLIRFAPVTATAVRVRVLAASAEPLLTGVRLFLDAMDTETTPEPMAIESDLAATVTQPSPAELIFDLGHPQAIREVRYTPAANDRVDRYQIDFATSPGDWDSTATLTGEFGNVRANPVAQHVACSGAPARYLRFTALRFAMGSNLSPADVGLRS